MTQPASGKTVFAEERKQQILDIIRQSQKIVVPELCNHFGVSASTIRNDLRDLTEAGLITRTHGGAISNTKTSLEPTPQDKESQMSAQKRAIARRAADLVDDGDTIAIGTGTTTLEFAGCLLGKENLTVVTHDIRIASFLEENSDFTLFILGGVLRRRFHYVNTTGSPLPSVNIDKMFFTCNGLTPAGATVPDFQLACVVSSIMGLANTSVLLCDSSKVGSAFFAQIAPLAEIGTIVVDGDIGAEDLKELQAQDKSEIVIANV